MEVLNKIKLQETSVIGGITSDYLKGKLDDLISFPPNLDGFKKAIEFRSKIKVDRSKLVQILSEQNRNADEYSKKNIQSLSNENTFTITTGHQICLFTGPLYFIYKIAHAIRLSEELKQKFTDKNFVPVYWMATEDHDFEEVSSANVFGKNLKWQQEKKGAVGRIQLTPLSSGHLPSTKGEDANALSNVLTELKNILGESVTAKSIYDIIERAYKLENLSEATRYLVSHLFAETGLVIIDADNAELKKLFIPIMQKELKEYFVNETVSQTNQYLENKDYKIQVNPREINLFYLRDNFRERIVKENGIFQTVNGEYKWKEEAIFSELNQHPENFSPNVLMRPLYQETILPNLAYIGGGGEISYWLQMKTMFEKANTFFPILMVRNSFLISDANTNDKVSKLGFEIMDFFQSEEELVKDFIQRNASAEIQLKEESETLKNLYSQLVEKVKQVDASLEGSVNAELQKSLKSIEIIEAKIRKSEKQKHEQSLNQIKNIKGKYFPEGSFQERYDNLLSFYLKTSEGLVQDIIQNVSPFESNLSLIKY